MEHTSNSLFSLTIDPVTKAHLNETARWAKFLAVVGLILLALTVLTGIAATFFMAPAFRGALADDYRTPMTNFENMGAVVMLAVYLVIVLIALFPMLFLLRFANKMKKALATNDQTLLNISFQNIKAYFRYLGIITIIVLLLYALIIAFSIIGVSSYYTG